MSWFFASLRTRLTLLTLIAVLPAFVLLFFTNLEQRRLARAEAQAEALRLVRLTSSEQNALIEGTHQLLTVLAQLPIIADDDPAVCSQVLAQLLEQNPSYINLGVATRAGDVTCSAIPLPGPVNVQDRTYFRRAIETAGFAVGDYQIGRITGKGTLSFGYPIVTTEAVIQGIVFAALDLGRLNQQAADLQFPANAAFTIIDDTGTVLARQPDPEQWVGQRLPEVPLIQAILLHQEEGTIEAAGVDGIERLYAFAPLRRGQAGTAYVAVGIPTAIAFAHANQMIVNNLVWLGITAVVVVTATWLFSSRFILSQVGSILRTTRRLAAGDLTARTGVMTAEGELNELALAFDDMAQSIAWRTAEQQLAEAENHRLLQTTQSHLRQLQALHTIDLAITANFELAATLNVVLEQAMQQMVVDAATILLLEATTGRLTYVAGRGFRGEGIQQTRLAIGEGYAGRALQSGRSLYINNLKETPDFWRSQFISGEEFVAYYCVPLKVKDQGVGVLELFHRQPLEPGEEWLRFLEALAVQAAIAIDNALLFSQTRQLLQKTQQQAAQVQQILENVPEGVALLNSRQKLVLANRAANDYLPLLAGHSLTESLTHLAGRPLAEILNRKSNGPDWQELELPAAQRTFQVSGQPMQPGAENSGWLLVVRDVTDERTRQEYLQAQQRLATVGQLAAGIAHDFNNIMAVITLYCGTLKHNPASPNFKTYLDTMIQQAQYASNLIEQILDFSRRSVMERSPLDLLPFVKEAGRLLERILPGNIRVQITQTAPPFVVHADPTRLQQVLMNLAVNARDAMPKGGKLGLDLAHLTLEPDDRPPLPGMAAGQWVMLAVADTGMGIPPELLLHIFEPFFTTKRPGEGTGLGLAQVYGIIKQHEGEIGVESRPGEGTTFTIYLPALEKSLIPSVVDSDAPIPNAASGETILLVEDNRKVAAAMQETIETLGYRVLLADNGRVALAIYGEQEEKINLVLSDLVMPYMGGVELYHALQARQPGLKMILTTGSPLDDEDKQLLEQGTAAWLQKPFSIQQLGATIRKLLDSPSTPS